MKVSFCGNSVVGKVRPHNEDAILMLSSTSDGWISLRAGMVDTNKNLGVAFVVADGVGGANAGEIASALAITSVQEWFPEYMQAIGNDIMDGTGSEEVVEKALNQIAMKAHYAIVSMSNEKRLTQGMGTTIVICWIVSDVAYVTWSGDSRCYVYKSGELRQLTNDHSLVWQHQVLTGQITSEQARLSPYSNLILQSLGGGSKEPEPEFRSERLGSPGKLLVCSDGLNSMISDDEIRNILGLDLEVEDTVVRLIEAASDSGGRDNISVIVGVF